MNFTTKDREKLDQGAEDMAYVRALMDAKILPSINKNIPELYKKGAENEKEIALIKQSHETCPAAKAFASKWHRSGVWIAAGSLFVSICVLIITAVSMSGCSDKSRKTSQETPKKMEKHNAIRN